MPFTLDDFKELLKPGLRKEDFRVFVFGPYLLPSDTVDAPGVAAELHEEVVSHAKYLRYATRKALEQKGFTVDFGETREVLEFWESHFGSPDPGTSEELQAQLLCGAVVMYPSSVGSICELGMFARQKKIAEKMLAIVHTRYEHDKSFFREGLLEVFQQENGRVRFVDYSKHEACIEAAIRFVSGAYSSVNRQIMTCNEIDVRNRGTFVEKFLKPSTY